MANDFINVNMQAAGASQAQLLKSFIGSLRQAFNLGSQALGIMNHAHDGTDFSEIEKLFGTEPGTGQTVFDLVNGSLGAMNGTFQNDDCKQITEQVG
jgi:hypothetical protein